MLLVGPLGAPRTPAKQVVEIIVRGHFFSAPATVPITIAVEPAADNRVLVVEADSDDYYRSSSIELDGDKEKRLHSVELRLSLIHISEPTRLLSISYAVFCLKKK